MTTDLSLSSAAPIVWLEFGKPLDRLTSPRDALPFDALPFDALPIAMQAAVTDRQQAILERLTTSNRAQRRGQFGRVAIQIENPWNCLVTAIAVHRLGCDLFLCDPSWSTIECDAVLARIQPTVIARDASVTHTLNAHHVSLERLEWSEPPPESSKSLDPATLTFPETQAQQTPTFDPQPWDRPLDRPLDRPPYWAIPTGGTSGKIRFACHTWQTLAASAIGVRDFFQRDRLNSFCALPVFHVSGLAQVVRAIVSGGQLALTRPATLRPDQPPPEFGDRNPREFWLSLVPTQLQRLIDRPEWLTWLQQFNVIFLGGAPAWTALLATSRSHGLRLAPTYGMTETASQVATLNPDDFLAGRTGCGQVLPHAKLMLVPDIPDLANTTEIRPQTPSIGLITIQARSLFRGYYNPALQTAQPETATTPWPTDDRGYLDVEGYLHIVGRASQKMITGGENVYPEEVEAAILATGLVRDVAVLGLPDREWGQIIAAAYVPQPEARRDHQTIDQFSQQIRDRLASKLTRYKRPKRWCAVEQLPRNDRGKLDRTRLAALFSRNICPRNIP